MAMVKNEKNDFNKKITRHKSSVIYKKQVIKDDGTFQDCELIDIDDGIYKIVLWINSIEGLSTLYSCEGGLNKYSSYVLFDIYSNDLKPLGNVIKIVKKANKKIKGSVILSLTGLSLAIGSVNVFSEKYKKDFSKSSIENDNLDRLMFYDFHSKVIKHRYSLRFEKKEHIDFFLKLIK